MACSPASGCPPRSTDTRCASSQFFSLSSFGCLLKRASLKWKLLWAAPDDAPPPFPICGPARTCWHGARGGEAGGPRSGVRDLRIHHRNHRHHCSDLCGARRPGGAAGDTFVSGVSCRGGDRPRPGRDPARGGARCGRRGAGTSPRVWLGPVTWRQGAHTRGRVGPGRVKAGAARRKGCFGGLARPWPHLCFKMHSVMEIRHIWRRPYSSGGCACVVTVVTVTVVTTARWGRVRGARGGWLRRMRA